MPKHKFNCADAIAGLLSKRHSPRPTLPGIVVHPKIADGPFDGLFFPQTCLYCNHVAFHTKYNNYEG